MNRYPRAGNIVAALIATVALLPVALWLLPFVRDASSSHLVDFLSIALWVGTAMTASWFQVAAIVGPVKQNGLVNPLRWSIVLRSALTVIAVLFNLYWSNVIGQDFWFSHYTRIGAFATGLRARDPETRRGTIARIAELASPTLVELVPRLKAMVEDPEPSVRADAIAALGHIARRMRLSIAILKSEGALEGRWEPDVLESVRSILLDMEKFLNSRGEERRAIIFALGALGEPKFIGHLRAVIEAPDSSCDVAMEATAALGEIPEGLTALKSALVSGCEGVRTLGAWAIAVSEAAIVSEKGHEADSLPVFVEIAQYIAETFKGLGTQPQCAYLRVFPKIGDARMTRPLIELAMTDARCERFERRPWFGRPEVIVKEGNLIELVLAAMSSIAVGNRELLTFLEKASDDTSYPAGIRAAFRDMLLRSRAGGKDETVR